jgi:hypothetical protein
VTSITRSDSTGTQPSGATVSKVDDDDHNALVSALKGQDFLIITLNFSAPPDLHGRICKAAGEAGVPYIMPNVFGFDHDSPAMKGEDAGPYSMQSLKNIEDVKNSGATYVAMACGFWYEWSLSLGEFWFGIDIKEKKVVFCDDGNTKINVSTWDQCGRAIAAFLALPVNSEGSGAAISNWNNKLLAFDSFRISQRDMLDSLNRVLKTTDADWEIRAEPAAQRVKDGQEEMSKGIITGFAKMLYARFLSPDGAGDYSSRHKLVNDVLGLPKEDLDEATKATVKMVEDGFNPFGL